MVTGNELTDNLTDWVTMAQAARICDRAESQVTRRRQQGRLTFRVSTVADSKKYYFLKSEIENWQDFKKGNPDLIDNVNGRGLDKETQKVFEAVISQVAAKHKDVVFKVETTKASVDIFELKDGSWIKAGSRKLS